MTMSAPQEAEGLSGFNDVDPTVDPIGLGLRMVGSDAVTGELLDVVRVTPDLGPAEAVEAAVRERATRFASAALPGLSPVVRVERSDIDGRVEVWSRRAEGFRLSVVLEWTEARGVVTPLRAALTIGDRLLAALSELQQVENVSGASGHGAIGVDQVVVNDAGVITITDYAFGTALASLQLTRDRLWRRYRVALPPAAGLARFDHRVDVTQAAVVITALLAGRRLDADEYPRDLQAIVDEAVRKSCADIDPVDRDRLHLWLRGATEIESRSAFASASAARAALREMLGAYLDDDAAVCAWLREARGLPAAPSPAAVKAAPMRVEAPAPPTVPAPVASNARDEGHEDGHATPQPTLTRFRRWLSTR